ncbi:uncharacterized protein LOC125029067 isoform X1 [Penaeus chinensis]|uniref:uncharacterized protein LOC125029067 isoform X1 n=1 Tax=Penaeus chinensis TaxID=139456 RepID=UPI001FB83A28|nr:uncharacterized protein LOC125029067 isoform X1 [Penaeus chinensis]
MSLLQEFSGVKCRNCGGVKRPWDMFLPITLRGSFFQDSFFSNLHQHFDATVRDILNRWCDSDLKLTDPWDDVNARHTDILDRYRQLRSRNLKEENQAVAVTSDDTSRKVVMDVHDFMGGDVKVKVVDEKDLVVEGSVEKKEGGSSVSSHSFRRRFSLPRLTDLSAIDSVMSSDGILTITTPKIESEPQHKTTIIPIQMEETQNKNVNEGASSKSFKCEQCSQKQTSVNGGKQRVSIHIKNYEPPSEANNSQPKQSQITQESAQSSTSSRMIPIEIEANEANVNASKDTFGLNKERQSSASMDTGRESAACLDKEIQSVASLNQETQSSESQLKSSENDMKFHIDSFPGHVFPITRRGLFFSDSFFQDSWNDFQKAVREVLARWGEQSSESQLKSLENDKIFQMDSFPGHFFPITTRGLFFNDSFFQDSWNDFQKAVREVLARWGEQSSLVDDLTSYRNLRSRDLREDTQAVTSSEDEHQHKFVIDVKDFMDGGQINVKAVNDRELVVSGHTDKNGGGSKSTKRFLRRFVVPGDIQLDAVTSAVSSDGVLTVSAPKKHSTLQIEEVFSPLSIEGSEKKLTSPGTTQSEIQNGQESPVAPPPTPSGATVSPVSQQTSTEQAPDSRDLEDSYPHMTAGSARIVEVPTETQPSSFSAPLKSVSARPKGKEGNEEDEEKVDYKAALKPRPSGGKFPIKISGTVINSNAV